MKRSLRRSRTNLIILFALHPAYGTVCPQGKYQGLGVSQSGKSAWLCFDCPWGKYVHRRGKQKKCHSCDRDTGFVSASQPCQKCTQGQWQVHGMCSPCPVGRVRPHGAQNCIRCKPGRSADEARLHCQDCIPGRFAPSWGTPCADCPAGKYGSLRAARTRRCESCPAGRFQPYPGMSGPRKCKSCPVGKHTHGADGQNLCTSKPCPPGKYGKLVQKCQACPVGCACTGGSLYPCPRGKFQGRVGSARCLDCPMGKFRDGSQERVACAQCARGSYAGHMGSTRCKVCPEGTVTPAGSARCSCTDGWYMFFVTRTGKNTRSTCKPCPPGQYAARKDKPSDAPAKVRCSWCPTGKYVPVGLSAETDGCVMCPGGMLCRGGIVALCPPGYFCPNSTATPHPCGAEPSNQYCPRGSAKPMKAQSGMAVIGGARNAARWRARACKRGAMCVRGLEHACGLGRYASSLGSTVCLDCPAGKFAARAGSIMCTTCPSGKHAAAGAAGAAACAACPSTFFSTNGRTACSQCPAGRVMRGKRQVECDTGRCCTQCAQGLAAAVPGSQSCVKCAEGKIASMDGRRCAACPKGRSALPLVERSKAKSACGMCMPGRYGPPGGFKPCLDCLPGRFSGAGEPSCKDCAAGQYQPVSGMNLCLSCAPEMWSTRGAATCLDCPAGRHSLFHFNSPGCVKNPVHSVPTQAPGEQQTRIQQCLDSTAYGRWSQCNRACGSGLRFRYRQSVSCKPTRKIEVFRQQQRCNTRPCTCLPSEHCDKVIVVPIPLVGQNVT